MTEPETSSAKNEPAPKALNTAFLESVYDAVDAGDGARLSKLLKTLKTEEFADLLHLASGERRDALVQLAKLDPEVLPYLDDTVREDVVENLETQELADAITTLQTDDAVEVIEALDGATQREVLSALPMEERDVLRTALSYPENSAGRLMQREFLAAPDDWDVQQCADYIRAKGELPDVFYDVFVVNGDLQVLGGIPLHRLITARPETPISEIMDEHSQRIPVLMEQKEVAYTFHRYGLISAPVEDESQKLVGMITIDDVMDIMEESATDELVHLSGVSEHDFYSNLGATTRSRFTWLFVNLLTALLATKVISLFEHTLATFTTVAMVMTIVASQGGDAGTQTLATAVRSLALRELTGVNAWPFLKKEITVGAINGLLFAVIVGMFAGLCYHNWLIALSLSLAMVINLIVAALAGTLIPLVLHRLRLDPAVSSSGLVTMVTDCCGFAAFLGLATLFLGSK